jgi:tRNA-uridine 2-sulfurtransferase
VHVVVAMSGGVDSSVAAACCLEAGHEVTGVTLRLWGGESDSGCCSVADVEDARRVAAQLGVPHYTFNFADDFSRDVVDPYVAAYAAGRTPNPCVDCNRHVKFGRLLDRALALGADRIATGHHARVRRASDGTWRLHRGADRAKDQSYVLRTLGQPELARTLLPVGELTKADVRARARELGLRTADKAESQDVCFITKGGRVPFLAARGALQPGRLRSTDGTDLGGHDGVAAFTIGQRRGLGVAVGDRRYVVDVDATTATVVVGARAELLVEEILLDDATWVVGQPTDGALVEVQTSAHGAVVAATLRGDRLVLAAPRPRVAPGQVVACYDGDELLGGAVAR